MPITPFHFGPGAAFKALAPGQVSFTVFAFSQCLIDLEPISFWLFTGDPVHPYLHTYIGALPVALASVWPGRRVSEWANRLWNSRLSAAQARWLGVEPRITLRQALAGAFLGAYSHVFIDSFMHDDMRPLAPFADGRLTGIIAIENLQWLCVAAAGAALLIFGVRARIRFLRT